MQISKDTIAKCNLRLGSRTLYNIRVIIRVAKGLSNRVGSKGRLKKSNRLLTFFDPFKMKKFLQKGPKIVLIE